MLGPWLGGEGPEEVVVLMAREVRVLLGEDILGESWVVCVCVVWIGRVWARWVWVN